MKFGKRIMLITIALAISGQFSTLSANNPIGQLIISEAKPLVSTTLDGIFVEAPFVSNMIVMNVLVYNGQNELVLNVRSKGEPAELLAARLPDGEYHYQATTIFQLDYPVGEGANYEDQGSSRQSGSFTVINGEISQDMQSISKEILESKEQSSLMDRIIDHVVNLAGVTLDVLVPSAHAQDLLASGDVPFVFWHDTSYVGCCDFGVGVTLPSATNGTWSVLDLLGANGQSVMSIRGIAGTTLNNNAFDVDPDGDLHWGDYFMHLDKGAGALSLGWASTPTDFSINGTTPDILLHDSSANSDSEWELQDNTAVFWGRASGGGWNSVMTYRVEAPSNSLSIASNGDVGIGTGAPLSSLEITRSDGSSRVLVSETGAPATRTLFQLENPGRTHFKIKNTDFGSEWVFTNAGSSFFVSLQGTGGPEFKILNNGNAVLAGTLTQNSDVNAKTAITDIDSYEILNLVSELPVTRWEYKDARGETHIGPMAQDFYAAFGLGKSETGISSIDTAGVALAAIQALNKKLVNQNLSLEQRIHELEQLYHQMEQQQGQTQAVLMKLLENQQAQSVLTSAALN